MSVKLIDMVLECDALTDRSEFCTMLVLANWSDDKGRCWPSLNTLAKKARIGKRGLVNVLQRLREKGFIEWPENAGGRSQSNRYTLQIDRLKGESGAPFVPTKKGEASARFKGEKGESGSPRKGAPGAHAKTRQLITNNPTTNPDRSALRGEDTTHAGAREEPPPPTPSDEPVTPAPDDLSWLPDNDQVYAPTIAELLAGYKPSNADQMLVHTWRQHSRVPLSSVHELLKTYPWPVFVAGVVIASDDRRPSLKFLHAILKRLTAYRHEHSKEIVIGADQPAGSHPAGGGAVIHRLEAGGGGSLPPRVRTGAAGSAAGAAGSAAHRKREGELTFREYLIRSGHPPAFVASLTDEQVARFLATGTFGEPAGGGGGIDAARLPIRACAER